jgi:hypothetical protein
MKLLQEAQSFDKIKPLFIPAIYHNILIGRKKMYQLSISIDGIEKIIKKSSKSFEYSSFKNVILGAVKRMERLFSPEHLNLEVIIYEAPNLNKLDLSIEFVNKNKFLIGKEEYFASVMCEYSYSKMNTVLYYPIIYRQVCSNGQVAVMSENFTENISTNKIFEIGCEWSRCNFESFQSKLSDYFDIIQFENDNVITITENFEDSFEAKAIKKVERALKININESIRNEDRSENRFFNENKNILENIISNNIKNLGQNQFAVWNAITEYASRENDITKRNQMFLNAGKYLAKEMDKTLSKRVISLNENLNWNELLQIAKTN